MKNDFSILQVAFNCIRNQLDFGSSGDTFMTTWFDWVTTTENSGVVLFVLSTTSYQLSEPCSFENTTREGRGIDLDKNEKNETHRMMK